jgi:hypothetical protein
VTAALVVAAILLWAGLGTSTALDSGADNLLLNSDLKSGDGDVPRGWKVDALPGCGFSFILHKSSGAAGEFEIINDEPAESSLQQSVRLKPSWYHFTAEIKVETLGSAGAVPELFAKSLTLPIHVRTHPLGWTNGWRKFHLFFKTGPKVREVAVGCALGAWGSPNTGRMQFRKPTLVATTEPQSLHEISDFENYDLEKMADSRFGAAGAEEAFLPAEYPSGRWWTVAAVYAGFLIVAIFGWCAVSPRRVSRPVP